MLWSIYTPLKQEYTAFVAWLADVAEGAGKQPALHQEAGSPLPATKPQ